MCHCYTRLKWNSFTVCITGNTRNIILLGFKLTQWLAIEVNLSISKNMPVYQSYCVLMTNLCLASWAWLGWNCKINWYFDWLLVTQFTESFFFNQHYSGVRFKRSFSLCFVQLLVRFEKRENFFSRTAGKPWLQWLHIFIVVMYNTYEIDTFRGRC
jgi:hypothetical protein